MKKFLAITATAFAVALTVNAVVNNPIVDKILKTKAVELITPSLVSKIIETRTPNFFSDSCYFDGAYYMCRLRTYEEVLGNEMATNDSQEKWESYLRLRTIMVAQIKGQLHQGNTLKVVYQQCRVQFKKVTSAQEQQFRANLRDLIKDAITSFEHVRNEQQRTDLTNFVKNEEAIGDSDRLQTRLATMLSQNLSAEKIATDLQSETVFPLESGSFPANRETSEFALRRWNEGGDTLVRKYLEVLRLAEEDVASTLPPER